MESIPEFPGPARDYPSRSWDRGRVSSRTGPVADEVPVALVYNGISHAVMLATPCNLEDFAVGFSLSEGIVADVREVRDVEAAPVEGGISVNLTIASEAFALLKGRRRTLAGRTGCGLCGTESIAQVFRPLPVVGCGFALTIDALHRAARELERRQPLHALTGAIHAAAWGRADGSVSLVREDVGRHNALDKLVGAMATAGMPFDAGFALLTSRASSEMVQKAATMGMQLVAAISAPTGLAIELAERSGVTLVGFVRDHRHTVFAHAERMIDRASEKSG
jgi:formate dehydrogenase accessory protein FdhD